jgi:hypothetical protein
MIQSTSVDRNCQFAMPGTYGHECGNTATVVGVRTNCKLTTDGIYYSARCPKCATIKGGENRDIVRFEPINHHVQINRWNGRYN